MNYFLFCISLAMVAGCSSTPVPYDQQFCTINTRDKNGMERCQAWVIGPSPSQIFRFNHKLWGSDADVHR